MSAGDDDDDDDADAWKLPLDEDFERELDRLAAELPPPDRLPADLEALYFEVRRSWRIRQNWDPDEPPVPFCGFEVFDARLGGMGMVLEAHDPQLSRKVAIKLWCRSGPEANAALLAEAQTLAKLSHPNVVTVYEARCWNDRVFFVMAWIEGVDGHTWMDTPRPHPWTDVLRVFIEAGKGLAAAHEQGIQHRDFKPANMLIGDDGRVLVADFGVAGSLAELDDPDDAEWIVGTPTYIAPERLEGGHGDGRSDQFSFCVAMWRALYGQRPYAGDTREQLLASIARRELRIGRRRVYVPLWLKRVVCKGLTEDPDDRHASMEALVQALLDGPGGDDERADSEFGEAVLRRHGGGRLHAPATAGELWQRWVGFAYGVVATAMVTLLCVAMFGGTHERATPTAEPAEPATKALEEPVLEEVIELVRAGRIDDADTAWTAEIDRRIRLGIPYGTQTVRVGEACLERAQRLAREGASAQARLAADKAKEWGRVAARDFLRNGEFTITSDDLIERAKALTRALP